MSVFVSDDFALQLSLSKLRSDSLASHRFRAAVPGLSVTTDNGIVCYTQRNGDVRWTEWSLMNRRVRFEVNDKNHRFDAVSVTPSVNAGRFNSSHAA